MTDRDEAELAADRLDAALTRIAARAESAPAGPDPAVAEKLDKLISALRTALDA